MTLDRACSIPLLTRAGAAVLSDRFPRESGRQPERNVRSPCSEQHGVFDSESRDGADEYHNGNVKKYKTLQSPNPKPYVEPGDILSAGTRLRHGGESTKEDQVM